MSTWEKIRKSRNFLSTKLERLGLKSWPSQTNFILVQMPDNPGAEYVYKKLKLDNILVRHFDVNNLNDKIRITIGSEDENKRFISSLVNILRI